MELVRVNDAMVLVLWTRLFLEAQGYQIEDNIVYHDQDNESTMLLAKNGRSSSTKNTRHIDIRYYFITDQVTKKRIRIEHCPTTTMLGDFFTKPLQGSLFRKFRQLIMNYGADDETTVGQECVGTSRNKSNDTSSTMSAVRDVAPPTIASICQQKVTQSSTRPPRTSTGHKIGGPQAATSAGQENRDDCSLVLWDCFNQT